MKKHPPTARSRTAMSCSTCGRRFFLDETPTPPFCSERCQLIDLGRWLDESIGVPFEGDAEDTPVEYRDEEPESQSRRNHRDPGNHRDIDFDDET